MSLTLAQTLFAIGPNLTSSFAASGGTAPYSYAVQPGGAGGTINASSGLYTAPARVPTNPLQQSDTIVVTDSAGSPLTVTGQVLIGDALLLFCDVIQRVLGLAQGRVYLWDQKINQPTDAGLYVPVSVMSCKPFANTKSYTGSSDGLTSNQSINMSAQLQLDIISRDSSARTRKEEVLMALQSDYAEQQQNANSFFIGKLPSGTQFTNLSMQDGAAIPYRFVIPITIQYFTQLTQATGYMVPSSAPNVNYVQS